MLCELETWPASAFVTLTYDDQHIPERGSLLPLDAELYMKRLRRGIEPRRIRFYLAGEYGEQSWRPHYHAILFGADFVLDKGTIQAAWPNGWSSVGSCTEHSIRYVADYIQAKLYGEKADEVYRGRIAPFARMSQGLGRDWCDARSEELRASMAINHRGHEVSLPRYFARRIGITADDTFERDVAHAQEVIEHHSARGNRQLSPWYTWDSVKGSNAQNGVDAEAKARLYPRKKL